MDYELYAIFTQINTLSLFHRLVIFHHKPVKFFHLFEDEDTRDQRLLNIITECNSLEPLAEYIQAECFKKLVGVINQLGSLEGIKMEQY